MEGKKRTPLTDDLGTVQREEEDRRKEGKEREDGNKSSLEEDG